MKPDIEIEEHYEGGYVVKRFMNGIEVPVLETWPVAVQFVKCVTTKTYMTLTEAKHKYGEYYPDFFLYNDKT